MTRSLMILREMTYHLKSPRFISGVEKIIYLVERGVSVIVNGSVISL